MIILCKLYKKKVVSLTISFIKKKEEFYAKIYYLDQDTIDTNYVFF